MERFKDYRDFDDWSERALSIELGDMIKESGNRAPSGWVIDDGEIGNGIDVYVVDDGRGNEYYVPKNIAEIYSKNNEWEDFGYQLIADGEIDWFDFGGNFGGDGASKSFNSVKTATTTGRWGRMDFVEFKKMCLYMMFNTRTWTSEFDPTKPVWRDGDMYAYKLNRQRVKMKFFSDDGSKLYVSDAKLYWGVSPSDYYQYEFVLTLSSENDKYAMPEYVALYLVEAPLENLSGAFGRDWDNVHAGTIPVSDWEIIELG